MAIDQFLQLQLNNRSLLPCLTEARISKLIPYILQANLMNAEAVLQRLNELVRTEQEKGLFATKEHWENKVEDYHYKWPHWMKKVHTGRAYNIKDRPGSVTHIGDIPYSIDSGMFHGLFNSPDIKETYQDLERMLHRLPTYHEELDGARRWRNTLPQIAQKDIHNKSSSVRHAIARYIPREIFSPFLETVMAKPRELGYMKAVKEVFESYGDQFKVITDKNKKLLPELAEKVEDILEHPEEYPKDALRYALVRCNARFLMAKETNLAMTLIAYQAAYVTYLQKFEDTVEQSNMPPDEKENALSVLHGAFKEFHHFATFAVAAPLILLERKRIVAQTYEQLVASGELEDAIETAKQQNNFHPRMSRYHPESLADEAHIPLFEAREHEFNKMAINAACETILTKGILESHHTSGASQKCPFSAHLRKSSEAEDIESIYDSITQEMNLFFQSQTRPAVRKLLPALGNYWFEVDAQTQKAVEEADPSHPAFIKKVKQYVDSLVEKGINPEDYWLNIKGDVGKIIRPEDYKYKNKKTGHEWQR